MKLLGKITIACFADALAGSGFAAPMIGCRLGQDTAECSGSTFVYPMMSNGAAALALLVVVTLLNFGFRIA
jgi:hypothetical protein